MIGLVMISTHIYGLSVHARLWLLDQPLTLVLSLVLPFEMLLILEPFLSFSATLTTTTSSICCQLLQIHVHLTLIEDEVA